MQTTLARYNAVDTSDAFALQGPEMLRVSVGQETTYARRQSLVAHHGTVKAESSEHEGFCRLDGTGDAFLGTHGRELHLVLLENEEIGVSLAHLLAWQDGLTLERDTEEIGGRLGGNGWVAFSSHGNPVLLDVGATRSYAHPDALVAWGPGIEVVRDGDSPLGLGFEGEGWALVGPARDD